MERAQYYVGTSGFSYSHWRGLFYPEGLPPARWLEHYAETFSTVELNNTFYRLPREATVGSWRERTPGGFLFATKASRLITHLRRLQDVEGPLANFLDRARKLEEKLGPILYQLPPNMRRDEELLGGFLELLPSGCQNVVEFRNNSWYQESVNTLLRHYNVAQCIHDMRDSESPVVATADFAYLRFHGASGYYYGSYSDEQLGEWAERINRLSRVNGLKVVYAYFNNDIGGHAVNNAQTLIQLL